MRDKQLHAIIETKFEIIQKYSSAGHPDWLPEVARQIHVDFLKLRKDISNNRTSWNYFQYCSRFAHHYYSIALLYYTFFQKNKVNLDIIRINLDKCLSKLSGLRSTEREIKKTQDLFVKATDVKQAIEKIYNELDNKLHDCSDRTIEAKILISLGQVEYENFDFFNEDLSIYKTLVLGVLLTNFISEVEEIITHHEEKDHYSKSDFCRYLAKIYQFCGHDDLHDQYMKSSSMQIGLAFEDLGKEDLSRFARKNIREIIKDHVLNYEDNLVVIFKVITAKYDIELGARDIDYVERKYIKYCLQGLHENTRKVLVKIAASNKEKVFIRLLQSLENVRSIEDFLDYFTAGGIYKLVVDYRHLLTTEQHKQCVRNYKREIWFTISPKLTAAQKELDVLKHLVLFLRSLDNCRYILSSLQANKFCLGKISLKKFLRNILNLNLPKNEELIELKAYTEEIKGKMDLFFMDKFLAILKSFVFPPTPIIDGEVMTLEGRFISLSEVMPSILEKKSVGVTELRIVGADVVYIDKDLPNSHWAGVNVLIVAKTVLVKGKHQWCLSGKNGEDCPTKANNGAQRGADGKAGINGSIGKSGGNVYISCSNIRNSNNLTIISNGGDGGKGQDGGDGAVGENGTGIRLFDFLNLISPSEPSYAFMQDLKVLFLETKLVTKRILNNNVDSDLEKDIEHLEKQRRLADLDIPIPKIAKEIKIFNITWSQAQLRLNVWNTGPCYIEGTTENNCNLTYSFYPHWYMSKEEVLILYEGTNARNGGMGGKGGLEGPGGYPGNVEITCQNDIIIDNEKPGEDGAKGESGKSGHPGNNGWDMGYVFVNKFWSKGIQRIIGRNQDLKLTIRKHYSRKDDDFVYCPYRDKQLNYNDHFLEIRGRGSNNNIYDRRNSTEQEQKQNKINASRTKAIARSAIARYEENVSNDVIDELNNLVMDLQGLKDQALEEIIEEDEEKEVENTNFQMQRHAVFDDSALQNQRKVLRKRQKYIPVENRNLYVDSIFLSPGNIVLWKGLKNIVVSMQDLQKLFDLLNNIDFTRSELSDIYKILLDKYKIIICQQIDKFDKTSELEVHFNLEPIENYLVTGSKQKFYNDDLGTLQEYFRQNDENFLSGLQNYLKTVHPGLILYPLKFFIMEKSNNNTEFQKESQIVLDKLNNLENRLERLIKSYMVAYEQDDTSSMLLAIEKRKDQIISEFKNDKNIEYIREEFIKYIQTIGMSSTAVRELLSCAFGVNIKIYLINQHKELIMYHNHNPTAQNILYLFLVNGHYVEFYIDKPFVELVKERKKRCKNYSEVLSFVNEFVCKKDFDEFIKNFSMFNGCEMNDKIYFLYRKLPEDEIIKRICDFFPKPDYYDIKPVISKLKSVFIKNTRILMSLVQRFDTEGLHISTYEMMFIVNTILKSYLEKNTNLQMFEWMINITPQSEWLNEIFHIELENHYKKSLTYIREHIRSVKQNEVLLLMYTKLKEATDFINIDSIYTCLEILGEIEIDEDSIRSLPLSKWQYILREQMLEYRLYSLVKWDNNDQLRQALYYLSCLEVNVSTEAINVLLGILDTRKDELSPLMCLDLFYVLYIHDWCVDYRLLEKISAGDINAIKEELKKDQQEMNKDRSLKTLLKIMSNNSQTSPDIKNALLALQEHPLLGPIQMEKDKTARKLKEWANKFKEEIKILKNNDKKQYIKDNTNDILMNILHAIKIKKGFILRKTQRLAILLMLQQKQNILAQISTGEGKSLIVVAISIFKALCGDKVDIITSSSVLAIRDAKIHKDIYDIFDVGVSHNCSEILGERRDAYSACPVIFGELSYFQRDFLLDRFHGMNILGDRTYDILIVDEVDSMVLDKGNNTLYLSHEIPGMDKIESVYQFLWKRICTNAGRKIEDFEGSLKKQVLFDLYGTLSIEDIEASLNISRLESTNIYNFLKDIKVIDQNDIVLKKIDTQKIPDNYKNLIDKLQYIIDRILKRETEIRIPKCLYKFVELHIDTWIKNGLLAIIMEERIDYVVDVDRTKTKADISPNITIIDKGTGTDQSNSQWEGALHQFLQLKHGCKVSTQSLKAVFISNVSYFQKYTKLFGLTGTLGSKEEMELLKELYDVGFVNIPTAKPKLFIEHEPLLCCTDTDWQFRIVNRTKELTDVDRSVLIICETIKEVNMLEKAFLKTDIRKKIYKREYEECLLAKGMEELDGGSVIIATNLAGRGTDIKITDKLNSNGGLHVLLSYLPSNARIEKQAFGRAARSGNKGSGQLIIIAYGSFMDKREHRETQERQRLADIKMYFDTRIKVEEKFFNDFTKVYTECTKSTLETKKKTISSHRLLDRWAFWIDEYGAKLSDGNIDKIFDGFKKDIKDNFFKWKHWTNDPIQLVKVGLNYLKNGSYDEAISVFDAVIKQEPIFSETAHYFKAAALAKLLDFGRRPFTGKDLQRYNEFLLELRIAERLFEAHRDSCMMSSAFIDNLKTNLKNSFTIIDAYSTQQRTLITLYDLYIRTIKDILGHTVHKTSFKAHGISNIESEEIYDKFLKTSVLKKPQVVEANPEDIEELSHGYGITSEALFSFLKQYEKKYIDEQDFLKDFKNRIKMPNLEDCWDLLIKEEKFIEETRIIIVDKSKLSTYQENILKKVLQVKISLDSSQGKYIFMKKYMDIDKEEPFIFEEDHLRANINTALFDLLEKKGILIFNRFAELSENVSQPISSFDCIGVEDIMKDGIVEKEAMYILNTLTCKKFLKKNAGSYVLVNDYNENNIPIIPPYNQTIIQTLRINFSYRIALQNIQIALQNSEELVYVKLISEPHTNLMWDLIEKKIIRPVGVQYNKINSINSSIKKYAKNNAEEKSIASNIEKVLKQLAGSLQSLDTPSFNVVELIEILKDEPVSPLQELSTFTTNGLECVLKSEEKKYTWKMIAKSSFLMILGVLEIAAGLLIQLFSAGVLSHVGGWLISEGVSDLQYTVSCWRTGHFNWDHYKEYKRTSMLTSLFVAVVTLGANWGMKYSKFGNKLAMPEVLTAQGEKVALLTGTELINEVGGKAVLKEYGKQFALKVGEGITRGLVQEGIHIVVESYLQNLCNQLANILVEDIENAVNSHAIGGTINESYRMFGPEECKVKMDYYSQKFLATTTLNNAIVAKTIEVSGLISTFCAEAIKKGRTIPYASWLPYITAGLQVSQYLSHIHDIINSIQGMLYKVNQEMKNELQSARSQGIKEKPCTAEDETNFKNNIISQWRVTLQENASNIFTERIVKPVLKDCSVMLHKQGLKKLWNSCRNEYHKYAFKTAQKKKDNDLQGPGLSNETRLDIINSYNDTLAKLLENIRDPDIYADIILEKGHMDAVCIKAAANVCDDLNIDKSEAVKLSVSTDSGLEIVCCEPGKNYKEINVELKDHHYFNKEDNNDNSDDYNCLYHAISAQYPELRNISKDEFRLRISKEIRNNHNIKNDIRRGMHAFTIRRRVYGGSTISQSTDELRENLMHIPTDQLRSGLLEGKYFLSQSSVSERTAERSGQPGIHLADLAKSIREKFDESKPINVVELSCGKYIFLDNRRVVAASTINNPEVKILVRIFKYDDILPPDLQAQYSTKDFKVSTALMAAEVRIQRTFSFGETPRCVPYEPKRVRIRPRSDESLPRSQEKEDFFVKASDIGFIKLKRSKSNDRSGRRRFA